MILEPSLSGKDKADALARELDSLKEQRSDFEGAWDEAQRLVSSTVLSFSDDDQPNKKHVIPSRITSRPANFMETLVSGICGYSVNPNILWLKLGLESREAEERHGVRDWLERVEELLYKEFNRGNLYSQLPLLIESAATFGHGAMLVDEDAAEGKIRCAAMSPAEIYLDTNEYGEADTVFRAFTMTVEAAAAFFGLERLSMQAREAWKEEGGKRKALRLLHAVYRDKSQGGAYRAGRFPYASAFVELDARHIVKEGGYEDFPYAVFVWKKAPGKKYGVGPAVCAAKDIRLLHLTEQAQLQVAQLSADPPYNVPARMKGSEQLVPNGRNYFRMDDGPISPVQVGANFPITLEITRNMEERIKDWFHVDFFLMLQKQSRQMTATEVVELQGEKAAVLSNLVNNLNAALRKTVQRSVDILFRQGKIPEVPWALRSARSPMKVDFMGILAQAQKKAHQYGGIMQGIQVMGALAGMAPAVPQVAEAFDCVDVAELFRRSFQAAGVSEEVLRERDDVEKIQRARAEAAAERQAQGQAMAAQETVAKNFKQLNEPVNPFGALARMGAA